MMATVHDLSEDQIKATEAMLTLAETIGEKNLTMLDLEEAFSCALADGFGTAAIAMQMASMALWRLYEKNKCTEVEPG